MPLFRREAREAQQAAWLGRIVLARPLSFSLLAAAALVFILALGLFGALKEYTRRVPVTGVLAPRDGLVRVAAPQAGRIEHVAVGEGERVRRGASLLVVVDPRAGTQGADALLDLQARMAERRRSLEAQRAFAEAAMRGEEAAAQRRRIAAQAEAAQLEAESASHERRAALAREALGRSSGLAERGFVSAAARDRDAEAALEAEARAHAMRRARLAATRELEAALHDADASRARAQAQLAAIDAQLAALEHESAERELALRAAIAAPAEGVVAALLVERGQAVAAGATLATLIPAGAALEAHLYAPSHAIGFVRPGQAVLLRHAAYPYQKFGLQRARIVAVSRSALAPSELGFAPPDGSREPLYRIRAELESQSILAYGRPEPLQAGQRVEADLLLERRRLIEWVFEPLLSLAGRA